MRNASFLINPAVAIKLVFLIEQEAAKLCPLIGFEHGRAVVLKSLVHFVLSVVARNRTRFSNQRTGGYHLRLFVCVEEPVHADDDDVDNHTAHDKADHEGKNPSRSEVFMFVLDVLAGVVAVIHHFITHIAPMSAYSCVDPKSRSVCGALIGSSGRDLKLWKKYAIHRPPIPARIAKCSQLRWNVLCSAGSTCQ